MPVYLTPLGEPELSDLCCMGAINPRRGNPAGGGYTNGHEPGGTGPRSYVRQIVLVPCV